jgi:uncharacterized protein (DUF924 family)
MAIATSQEILDFWFADENRSRWFEQSSEFDSEITKKFLSTYKELKKKHDPLAEYTPEDMLSLVIVLDQFPRNMFRGKKESFSTDNLALRIANNAIKKGYDKLLNDEQRRFLYLPFMHSEDIKDQRYAVALFTRMNDRETLEYAYKHKETIVRFGRFPQRNSTLERKSTPKEQAFLAEEQESAA